MTTVKFNLMIIVFHSSPLIGCATEINGHFVKKIFFVRYRVHEAGGGRGAILSNRSKKVGKHCLAPMSKFAYSLTGAITL